MAHISALVHAASVLGQQPHRLPPQVRKAVVALLAIVLLGIGLVLLIVLGGRVVKRLARQRNRPSNPLDDAWYRKPLEPKPSRDAPDDDDR